MGFDAGTQVQDDSHSSGPSEADAARREVPEVQGKKANEKMGTVHDQGDMHRMGKKQQLRRNFRLVSMLGFTMALMASWEASLALLGTGLETGGKAGLVWITFIAWISLTFVNTSMAEMGSMAPTSGGQYHWISEFAPPQHQKFLSYLMGWLCVLAWQTGPAGVSLFVASAVQGLMVINNPDYVPESWHLTLLMIAAGICALAFNTFLARHLPLVEGLILVVHVGAFIAVMTVLWVLGPRDTPANVFGQFSYNGWSSQGVSMLTGISAGIAPLVGADGAVHMSEELQDASKTVPRSMVWSTICNGALGWIMVITICFCMGSVDDILSTPTGQPFIQIFYNVTGSLAATNAMTIFVIILLFSADVSVIATSSRQLFAFARDSGLPCSSWLSKVVWDLPVNSLVVTLIFLVILSTINLGSAFALNNILSLNFVALLSSYMVSISCMIWRRATGNPLPPSKFNLGKFALPINVLSVALLFVFWIFSFFPLVPNPTTETMNWAALIYGAVLIFSLVYYHIWGKHHYDGPVAYVRKMQ